MKFIQRCAVKTCSPPWPFLIGFGVFLILFSWPRLSLDDELGRRAAEIFTYAFFFISIWFFMLLFGLPLGFVSIPVENKAPVPPTPLSTVVFYISMAYVLVSIDTLLVNPSSAYLFTALFLVSFLLTRFVLDGYPSALPEGRVFEFAQWLHSEIKKRMSEQELSERILQMLLAGRYLLLVPLTFLWFSWSNRDFSNVVYLLCNMASVLLLWPLFIIGYRFLLLGPFQRPSTSDDTERLPRAQWGFNWLVGSTWVLVLVVFTMWIPFTYHFLDSWKAVVRHMVYPAAWLVVLACGLHVLHVNMTRLKNEENPGPNLRRTARLFAFLLVPFVGAWIGSSLVDSVQRALDPPRVLESRDPGLNNCSSSSESDVEAGPKIWLALSGGGYRASAIHSGVLEGLKEIEARPQVVSSVSGGSIVGAFYAAGGEMDEFRQVLIRGNDFLYQLSPQKKSPKLGLWDFTFHVYNVARTALPGVNRTTVYADFFKKVYFGDLRLSDVQSSHLLINTTDLKQSKRIVLYGLQGQDIAPSAPSDSLYGGTKGDIDIGRAVASSGAFPGAFRPLIVEDQDFLPLGQEDGTPRRWFIDGGAVDNLGLDGLAMAYQDQALRDQLGEPALIIVSDASSEAHKWKLDALEPDFSKFVTASSNVPFQANHERLLWNLVGSEIRYGVDTPFEGKFLSHWLDDKKPRTLEVVFLDPTSERGKKILWKQGLQRQNMPLCEDLHGLVSNEIELDALIDFIAKIPTLKELNAKEVRAASAVGKCMLGVYQDKIPE